MICLSQLSAQQGHIVRGNEIFIGSQSHWQAWDVAGGTTAISDDGTVSPRFIRKNINAALDAADFSSEDNQGGVVVGSNQHDARFLTDGDPNTSWGPDTDDPMSDWWIELHLGRVVVAEKVILRFANEGDGDPFLQFKISGWRSPPSRLASEAFLAGTDIPKSWELGRTRRPNKSERVFEFIPDFRAQNAIGSPESQISTNEFFIGDPLELILIDVTDSDFDRASEVASAADHAALDDAAKGAVVHHRQEPSGRLTEITQEEYESIDAERRGPISFFRKEIPKLAEMEVWTAGDNLNLGVVERGGIITVETNNGDVKDIGPTGSDGRYSTGFTGTIFGGRVYDIFVHLGALYWLDTFHFLMDGKSGFPHMAVDVSDGRRAPDGSLLWTRVAGTVTQVAGLGETGVSSAKFWAFGIEPTRVRYIRAPFGMPVVLGSQSRTGTRFVSLTELLLYGEGYIAETTLTSDLIRLNDSKNLLTIEWEADTSPGTSLLLQTRSGNTLGEILTYHNSDGVVITPARYDRLPESKKGEITSLFEAGGDWSPWSAPYRGSGATITSPSPRQYLEIRATLSSDRPEAAASLSSIRVNLTDPVADRLVSEIWPVEIDSLSRPSALSLYIKPSFATVGQGFDDIRIEMSDGGPLELEGVSLGSEGDFINGEATIVPLDDVEILKAGGSSVWFRLPELVGHEVDLIEVRLVATLFATSTSFTAAVQDSRAPGLWQRVDQGNATDLVNSQTSTALAVVDNRVIHNLQLSSPAISPNGDGVNDELTFIFSVARISGAVTLTVFDLSGSTVAQISERRSDPRGRYAITWKGDGLNGNLVPPGTYLTQLEVEAQSAMATATTAYRVVHVAY